MNSAHALGKGWDPDHELFLCIPDPTNVEFRRIDRIVAQHSSMDLTYKSDAINAIEGIFNAMNVRHYWGMPLEKINGADESSMRLAWYALNPGKARAQFPSWSWIGSIGEKRFYSSSKNVITCELSLSDGTWLTADDYIKSIETDSSLELGRLLRVTGYISRPYFFDQTWAERNVVGYSALHWEVCPVSHALLKDKRDGEKNSRKVQYQILHIYMDIEAADQNQTKPKDLSDAVALLIRKIHIFISF